MARRKFAQARLSRAQAFRAAKLRQLFGSTPGTRRILEEITRKLSSRIGHWHVRDVAIELMKAYHHEGLVELAPGPRGGLGWALTVDGASLIERSMSH